MLERNISRIPQHVRSKHLLAHTQHAIYLLDSKPVQDIRHQGLESHILHASNILSPFEVLGGAIGRPLSSIVDKVLQTPVRLPALNVRNGAGSLRTFVTSPKARPSFLK